MTFPGTRDVIRPVAEEVAALPSAEIIPYSADLPGAEILGIFNDPRTVH